METEIQNVVSDIAREYQPERVILFGSQARGNADTHSDVDLLIIKKTNERFIQRLVNPILMKVIPGGYDFFVYTPEEFKQMQENENPFITHALESSEIVYEKS